MGIRQGKGEGDEGEWEYALGALSSTFLIFSKYWRTRS